MNKKIKKKRIKSKNTKKWINPTIKEYPIQDYDSSAFHEILLGPNDPVTKG